MNISVQKLLSKIEEELRLAKTSSKEERLREKVYSIKILCELILDEKQENGHPSVASQPIVTQPSFQQQVAQQQAFQQSPSLNQPPKMDLGDEANGDSLFDF